MPRILIVDDDHLVSATMKDILERAGYNVTVTASGQDGLKIIEEDEIDVAVVDLFLPQMDGLETIRAFNKTRPELAIIAMSGFTFRDGITPAPDFLDMTTKLGALRSLRKPFRGRELLAAVEACLPAAPPPVPPAS